MLTIISKTCPFCSKQAQVTVEKERFIQWKRAGDDDPMRFVQNSFPDLTIEQREMLISGTHPECWDKFMGEEDAR